MQLCGRYLRVARRPSEHWLANHPAADQLPGAMDLGICTAIVGYAQGAAALARLRDHPFRLGQVHEIGRASCRERGQIGEVEAALRERRAEYRSDAVAVRGADGHGSTRQPTR